MAAKIKLNSNLGGSVSFKVDDTLTTDEEVVIPSDGAFGIESGSNANGNWTKLPDGTLLLSGSKTDSMTNEAYKDFYFDAPFPFIFGLISIGGGRNQTSSFTANSGSDTNSSTQKIRVREVTVNTGAVTQNLVVYYTAIGRWK